MSLSCCYCSSPCYCHYCSHVVAVIVVFWCYCYLLLFVLSLVVVVIVIVSICCCYCYCSCYCYCCFSVQQMAPKAEIDRMVQEAERFKSEDEANNAHQTNDHDNKTGHQQKLTLNNHNDQQQQQKTIAINKQMTINNDNGH